MEESIFSQIPTSSTPASRRPKPKSILKPNLLLPTIIPIVQSQEESPGPDMMEFGSLGSSATPRRRVTNLDMSGVGLLTPEVASATKAKDRRGRRSNVSREQFLSFVFNKEASPPPSISTPEPASKLDMEILSHESESSDDEDWEALKSSDGSVRKLLPPPSSGSSRKSLSLSVFKMMSKEQPRTPNGEQSGKKIKKNLEKDLVRKVDVKEQLPGKSSGGKAAFVEKRRRRKSYHGQGTIMEEEPQSKLDVPKPQRRRPSCVGLGSYLNKDVYDSTKLTCKGISKRTAIGVNEGCVSKDAFVVKRLPDDAEITFKETVQPSVVSTTGRKRKTEEVHNETSKRAKSDVNILMNMSPFGIMTITPKLVRPFRPPLKTIASPSILPSTREGVPLTPLGASGQVSTSPCKSPGLSRCPTDPLIQKTEKTVLENLTNLTQKAHILLGTSIFVDFRAENENRSNVIKNVARELGAAIADKLGPGVTHVIFKDGSRINYQKAKKSGLPILSAGWLEESKKEGRKMPECQFPSVSLEKYDTPGLFPKAKKMKSMQPKTLDEDFEAVSKAQGRKQKMMEKKQLKEKEAKKLKNPVMKIKYPPHEHYYKGSPYDLCKSKKSKSTTDSSLSEVLKEFQTPSGTPVKLEKSSLPNLLSPRSPSECDYDTPLARRLANKYQSPLVARGRIILGPDCSPAWIGGSNRKEGPQSTIGLGEQLNDSMTSDCDTPLKLRKGNLKENVNRTEEIPKIVVTETSKKLADNSSPMEQFFQDGEIITSDVTQVEKKGQEREKEVAETDNPADLKGVSRSTTSDTRRSVRTVSTNSVRRTSSTVGVKKLPHAYSDQEPSAIVQKSQSRRSSRFQTPFKRASSEKKDESDRGLEISKPNFVKKRFVLSSSTSASHRKPDFELSKAKIAPSSRKRKQEGLDWQQVEDEFQENQTPTKRLRV